MMEFEDLETEIQVRILSYLDVNSLLRSRLVSKCFKKNVNRVRIDSLVVNDHFSDSEYEYDAYKYFLTNDLISNSVCLSTANLKFFESSLMRLILSKIRRLCFNDQDVDMQMNTVNDFDLELFNQFKHLEHLEIGLRHFFKINCRLQLPNLQVLSFKKAFYFNHLQLECPNLYAFRSENSSLQFIQFYWPEKITHLFIRNELDFISSISQFVNLVYLFLIDGFILSTCLPDFLNFNRLEELHLGSAKSDVISAIWNKRQTANLDFDIYLKGFRVDKKDDLKPFIRELSYGGEARDFQPSNFTEFLLTKYSRTCEVMNDIIIKQIDYNTIMEFELPNDFHQKVININLLKVKGNDSKSTFNEREFINFLKKIKGLISLQIDNVLFDKFFYNNLNAMQPLLKVLRITFLDSETSIPLDFLLNLKRLMIFKTNVRIRADLVKDLFNQLENFESFSFVYRDQDLKIRRERKNFRLTGFDDLKFDDLDFIVSLLRKLKS